MKQVKQLIKQAYLFFEGYDADEQVINFKLERIENFEYQVQIASYFDVKFKFILVNFLD